MSKTLLMKYIRMALVEAVDARVPNQLLQTSDVEKEENNEVDEENIDEFSGAGAVAGYTAPLGMSPDAVGRKKNKV